jgi:hypothetical protein
MRLRIIIYSAVLLLCIIAALIVGFNSGVLINGDDSDNKMIEEFESTGAVRLLKNSILLIKMDSGYGAIKMLKSSKHCAKVKWWYQEGLTSNTFSDTALSDIVKLKERFKMIKGEAKPHLEDKGSVNVVKIHGTNVKWSAPNWFYYDSKFGLVLKGEADIKKVVIDEHDTWTYIK